MSLLYFVSGMFCGTCVKTVESRVRMLPEVSSAELNFASKLLRVEVRPGLDVEAAGRTIEREIGRAGFAAKRQQEDWLRGFHDELAREHDRMVPPWLLCLVFFFAMWSSTAAFAGYLGSLTSWEKLLLASLSTAAGTPALLLGAFPFALAGARALFRGRMLTIDLFVALGAGSALAVSLKNLWQGFPHSYVDSAAMILVVLLAAKVAEGRLAKAFAGRLLYHIQDKDPSIVRLSPNGPRTVAAAQLCRGDMVACAAGETVPVDGCLMSPQAELDSHLLTGESANQSLRQGAAIVAGSIARSPFHMLVHEPLGHRLIDGWAESALTTGTRPHRYSELFRKMESRLTLLALGGSSVLSFLRYAETGNVPEAVEAFFVGVLIFCPCLFASILPLSKQVAHLTLARRGLLLQRAESLFDLAGVEHLYLDKTGTLEVLESTFWCSEPDLEPRLALLLADLRRHCYHPVLEGLPPLQADVDELGPPQMEEQPGQGLAARWPGGDSIVVGRPAYVRSMAWERSLLEPDEFAPLVAYQGRVVGRIVTAGTYHTDAQQTLGRLRRLFPKRDAISILSGDPSPPRGFVQSSVQLDGLVYHGNLTPAEKADLVRPSSLFVGDGLNDSLALARATVSLRVGRRVRGFTPVDLQLLVPSLSRIPELLDYARKFRRVLAQTALLAGVYNLLAWTLAGFGWFTPFGAVLAMLTSLLLMLLSSLRLGSF